MNTLKQRLLTNWHIIRIFRTGIGIMLVVMAIQSKDWMLTFLGAFFLYQGVMDKGCCGTRGCCNTTDLKRTANKGETIEYEEVK